MKVLIIVPIERYETDQFLFSPSGDFHTGLAYIASALKKAGHEVQGLNPNNDINFTSPQKMLRHKLNEELKTTDYDVVCLGGLCAHYRFLKDSIKLTRKNSPNAIIICGGGIINNDAEFILKNLQPDFCVIGEGEETIVKLLEAIDGSSGDYENISNIGYLKGQQPYFTNISHDYGDIDDRAFPDYSIFDMDDMLDNGGLHNRNSYRYTRNNPRVMPIITAVGCPFNCTFCVHNTKQRYRARSISKIMEEIKQMYERYHFNILVILDELFALKKDRLRSFCRELIKNKNIYNWDFDWLFQTHAKAELTIDDLKMLKEAGCYFFSYGIESASPKVLKSMNKRIKPSQISTAIELSKQVKIGFGGNFIFGDLSEDIQTVIESISFFEKYCQEVNVNIGVIHPYPGSKLFDEYCKKNNFTDAEKLAFYENIDQEYINLTTMNDSLWTFICRKLFLLSVFRWEKSAVAISCLEEKDSPDLKWAKKINKKVYRITATCPFCGQTNIFREALSSSSIGENLKNAKKKKYIFNVEFNMSHHPNKIESINKLNHIIDQIGVSQTEDSDFFTTGCPSCHKRFNVVVSGNFQKTVS